MRSSSPLIQCCEQLLLTWRILAKILFVINSCGQRRKQHPATTSVKRLEFPKTETGLVRAKTAESAPQPGRILLLKSESEFRRAVQASEDNSNGGTGCYLLPEDLLLQSRSLNRVHRIFCCRADLEASPQKREQNKIHQSCLPRRYCFAPQPGKRS